MNNKTTAKGIVIIIVSIFFFTIGYRVAPETITVEKTIEVEKIVKEPATHQDVYAYCANQARGTLYSTWDGQPREGTTVRNTQDFIDDCFTKLTIE